MQTIYRPENGESGLSDEGADNAHTPRIFGLEPPLVLCCQSHLRRQQKIMDKNSTPSNWPKLLIATLLTQRLYRQYVVTFSFINYLSTLRLSSG